MWWPTSIRSQKTKLANKTRPLRRKMTRKEINRTSHWAREDCLIRSKQVATVCVVCVSVIITQYYHSTVWRYPITTHTTLYSILIINGTYVNIYHFSLTYCVSDASSNTVFNHITLLFTRQLTSRTRMSSLTLTAFHLSMKQLKLVFCVKIILKILK